MSVPWADRDGSAGVVMRVPGLYDALRERERQHQDRHDSHAAATGLPYRRNRRLLDALEAGELATLMGRRLRGWGVPKVPLRREQAFDWFVVSPDDALTPTKLPDD